MSTHPLRGVTAAAHRYREVLRLPGATAFALPAGLARQGVAMLPLALLFAVRGGGGSFALAGTTTAAFALAEAVTGPQLARLVDRHGQHRMVPFSLAIHLCALVAMVTGIGHAPVVVAFAALAGAAVPQPGALSAARWAFVIGRGDSGDRLTTALSFDAAVNDLVFLVGPSLVAVLTTTIDAVAGLVTAGVLVGVGTGVLLTRRSSEPEPAPGEPLRRVRGIGPLLVVNAAMGVFFGAAPIAVTAAAGAFGRTAATGPILTTAGMASLLAGVTFGGRARKGNEIAILRCSSAVMVVVVSALAAAPALPVLAVGYLVAGGAVAPVLIPAALLMQRTVPPAVYTQAVTWANSASALGIAVAGPITGWLVDAVGWRAAFPLAAAGVTIVPLIARRCR